MRQKTFPVRYSAPKTADDCHDWLTAEDVIRHALAAFYAASAYYRRSILGPADLFDDSRAKFAEDLCDIFNRKLHDQGFKGRVPGFHGWASETIAWWIPDTEAAADVNSLDIHRRASHNGNDL